MVGIENLYVTVRQAGSTSSASTLAWWALLLPVIAVCRAHRFCFNRYKTLCCHDAGEQEGRGRHSAHHTGGWRGACGHPECNARHAGRGLAAHSGAAKSLASRGEPVAWHVPLAFVGFFVAIDPYGSYILLSRWVRRDLQPTPSSAYAARRFWR